METLLILNLILVDFIKLLLRKYNIENTTLSSELKVT